MAIVPVGIDLAKNVFAVHGVYSVYGVNESGKPDLVRPEVPPARVMWNNAPP